jgi:hypothetical protein
MAMKEVAGQLADHLALRREAVRIEGADTSLVDGIIRAGRLDFAVEWKSTGAFAQVTRAAEQVRRYVSDHGKRTIPLVAVPFMGPAGQEQCDRVGVQWLDLSGNASIVAPGLRIKVLGQPNRFRHAGRPASPFAPKSSRVARWLLMHPGHSMTQRELGQATEMDEGYTSRIVAKLEADGLVRREPNRAIAVTNPALLLDAWREDYDFGKHRILKGHVPARSSEALLHRVADQLRDDGAPFAATGLAAAWLIEPFAGHRLVTVYAAAPPAQGVLQGLGFREEVPGSNLWLVVPADAGVFHGVSERQGLPCVHPIQVYVDLKAHPERAEEAAERLRAGFSWAAHA